MNLFLPRQVSQSRVIGLLLPCIPSPPSPSVPADPLPHHHVTLLHQCWLNTPLPPPPPPPTLPPAPSRASLPFPSPHPHTQKLTNTRCQCLYYCFHTHCYWIVHILMGERTLTINTVSLNLSLGNLRWVFKQVQFAMYPRNIHFLWGKLKKMLLQRRLKHLVTEHQYFI